MNKLNNDEKNPILNYRPLTVVFLSMIVGINLSIKLANLLYLLAILLSIFIVEICRIMMKKRNGNKQLVITRVILFSLCFGMILGMTQVFIQFLNDDSYYGTCEGRIKEIVVVGEITTYYCEDFTVDSDSISGNVVVKDLENRDLLVGDKIRYDGNLDKLTVISENRVHSNYLRMNVTYKSEIGTNFMYQNGAMKISERIRESSLIALNQTMAKEQAGISYAMLFGDTTMISGEVLTAFQLSGISHMFAVSGLHIGIFYGFLKGIFLKLRLRRNWRNTIVLLLVCYYTYICGMTPSSIRATVMVMVFTLAEYVNTEVDSLSSLSMAGIVVLIISPFSSMTAGFSLSFIAVLSLISIGRTISFKMKNYPNKLRNAIPPIIAVQLLTVPIVSYYFGYIAVLSPLVNLFLIPIVSAIYIFNLVSLAIFQLIGLNLLQISGGALRIIANGLGVLSDMPYAKMNLVFSMGSMLLYYSGLFVISDYVMIRKSKKVLFGVPLLLLSLISLFL